MEPIISPWLIYLIQISNSIKGAALSICICAVVGIIVGLCMIAANSNYGKSDAGYCAGKSVFKKSVWLSAITAVFAIFLPGTNTSVQMIVASYVTEDNLNAAVESVEEVADYIFDKINGVEVKE